jgi:predicted enzyme related to lactoylglutathione lyase
MTLVLDYIELPVDDLEKAKVFYANALGWTFNDYGPDYAGLQDPRNPGKEFGGLNADRNSTPGAGVLVLARTDDADAALAAVLAAGARVVAPLYEYPGGRRFTFADPFGNVLGIYEPAE